jgi:O-antigen/teichoic acid export membrane protein
LSILARARPLLLARLAGAALMFLVPVALARLLTPDAYGGYKQAWLIVSTLHYTLPLGITLSLYYFVPRDPSRAAVFVGQTLAFTTGAGVVAFAAVVAGRPLLATHLGGGILAADALLVAAAAAFTLAGTSFDVALNALGRIRFGGLVRFASDVARGLAMVVGAWATGSLRGLLWGLAAASAARAVAGFAVLARDPGLAFSWPELRRQLAYALPIGLASLLFVPQQSFHQWAVAAHASAAAFAVYSVGCFQLPVVDILYTPVSEVLQIGIAEEERRGVRAPGLALFRDAVARLALVFVPTMGFASALAPELITLLFTDRYLDAVAIMRVSLLAVPLAALPIDGVLRARAQQRFMVLSSAAKLAVTVPAVLAGLRVLGPVGAMAGYVAAEALVRTGQLARVARLFEVGLREVLPWRQLGSFALGSVVGALAAIGAARFAPDVPLAELVAAAPAFLLAYVTVLAALGALPPGAGRLLRRFRAPAPVADRVG